MKLGEPIWVESLMNDKDYSEMSRLYPNTYAKGSKKVEEFDCDFKWRKGMGASIPIGERELVNKRLDEMKKLVPNKN